MSEKNKIIQALYEIGAIQFGEFKLKSGKTSSIYLNLRKIISYPTLLRTISEAMWAKIKDCEFNLVCGVPYTALPIATCLSLDHHIPMVMRRKEKKEHGTKQSIEGVFSKGDRVLIIEDVITTGGSILETTKDLENEGLIIQDVIALIDREQGGYQNLSQHYQTHSILTMSEILNNLSTIAQLKPQEREIISQLLVEKSS